MRHNVGVTANRQRVIFVLSKGNQAGIILAACLVRRLRIDPHSHRAVHQEPAERQSLGCLCGDDYTVVGSAGIVSQNDSRVVREFFGDRQIGVVFLGCAIAIVAHLACEGVLVALR